MISTKEELSYVMKFYGIERIEVINRDGLHLGHITSDMDYIRDRFRSYRKGYEYKAFEDAIRMLNNDMDFIKCWDDIRNKLFTTRLVCHSDSGERFENSYLWKSDISECGLDVVKDNDGSLVFSGSISGLSAFLDYCNDHYRYCNGTSYRYDNDELTNVLEMCRKYGLKSDGVVEYKWYRVGIVD